jgi:hypothetical protein
LSPAISFSGEPRRGPFYQLIWTGEKKQTVRAPRCHPIKRGDDLKLYWKQRVPLDKKPVHLIGIATCTGVERVKKGDFIFNREFAKADGFTDELELQEWFGRDDLNFDYEVIHFELKHPFLFKQSILASKRD